MLRTGLLVVLVGCGAPRGGGAGSATSDEPAMIEASKMPAGDRESGYGPLEVGADYASYRRVTTAPFLSLVHGNRWVHVFVNELGADAYLAGSPMPVGSIVVKPSWQDRGGVASEVEGPIFIMEKRAAGYAPDHDDWYFALHWAAPPPEDARRFGGPIYWRGSSPRVAYCYECHDSYDRSLGGLVPSSLMPR